MQQTRDDLHRTIKRTTEAYLAGKFEIWLHCDGRQVPKKAYPDLFKTVGTNYGPATRTHFTLPNTTGVITHNNQISTFVGNASYINAKGEKYPTGVILTFSGWCGQQIINID